MNNPASPPPSDVWTITRLLAWTTDYLKNHGADDPRLDAEVLLAESLGCERIDLYTAFDRVPDDDLRAKFRGLVRRRAEGTPVAYLVGRREFFSLTFRVTPDVLIPRPETEHLVLAGLEAIRKLAARERTIAVADVGTGSGAIAVCVAKYAAQSHVTAIDISRAALEVARQNAATHGVSPRIDFVASDLFAALPAEQRFDVILSNPPYIAEHEFESLSKDVRQHEPRGALLAGPTGIEVIARLVPQAAERLPDGGWLMLEISPMIEDKVRATLAQDGRFAACSVDKDLAGRARVIKAQRSGGTP